MAKAIKTILNKSVDYYILSQRQEIVHKLEELRHLIIQLAPTAEEVISYAMPAYKYHGMLVGFACAKNHIGFYTWNGHTVAQFKDDLKDYATTKSAIHLSLNKPLPKALLKKIIKARIQENELKQISKRKKSVI